MRLLRDKPLVCVSPSVDPRSSNGLEECVCRFTPVRLEIASVAPVCMDRLLLVRVRVTRTLPLVESHVSLFLALWLGRVCVTRAIAFGERLILTVIKMGYGVHVGLPGVSEWCA